MQLVHNLTPLEAGTVIVALALAAVVASLFSGSVLQRFGTRRVLIVGIGMSSLGVATLGGVLTSVYTRTISIPTGMDVTNRVKDGLDAARIEAQELPKEAASLLLSAAVDAFDDSFVVVVLVAAAVMALMAVLTATMLRGVLIRAKPRITKADCRPLVVGPTFPANLSASSVCSPGPRIRGRRVVNP